MAEPFDDLFDALHLPEAPEEPEPGFAGRLRHRLEAELIPDLPIPPRILRPPARTTNATRSTPMVDYANSVVPYLAVNDAAAAIDFYVEVFGVAETMRFTADDGRVGHADLAGNGIHLMLSDEYPDMDVVGPLARGGASLALHVDVADVDATYARAVAAGATALREPADQPHGNRHGDFLDPFGHRWMVSTPIASPTVDQLNEAMEGFTVTAADSPTDAGEERGPHKVAGAFDHTGTGTTADPVELGYIAMGVGDAERAGRFFGELFGWAAELGTMGPGYGHVANTRFPIGLTPEGPAATPTLYFRVGDIDRYAEKVEALGGTVVERDSYASGGNAQCRDDQGNEFRLWSPAPGY